MPDVNVSGFRVSDSLREDYYRQGYWCHDDFWTSFAAVADQHAGQVALVDRDREITFAEFKARAVDFAAAAVNVGCRPGDVVVIHGRHCIEAVVAIVGCAYGGLIPALLPAMFSVEQIQGIIAHTHSRLLLALGEDKELDRAIQAARGANVAVVVADNTADDEAALSWSQFHAAATGAADCRHPSNADELMLLIFSSGTTGAPKGVMHSANTARFAVRAYADMHQVSDRDVELVITAFGFVGSSLLGFYLSLLVGCKSILMRNWSADDTIAFIECHRASHFLLMPTHAIDILNSPLLDKSDCTSAARAVVAGVAAEYRLEAKKRLCGKPFPMYGMSESPAHCTGGMDDNWDNLLTTEGRNLPGTEVLICDEDGKRAGVGQHGDILVRGPNRFLGYYKADYLNESVITTDGYFRTGDIGFIDDNGCMTFVSRSKDIIRRGGVTITPADIESALRSHPDVADIAVIGLPDPRLGERACACVITGNSGLILDNLTDYLGEKGVAQYLWPESLQLCTEFPRTPSLKVQKNQLKDEILKRLADQG